MDIWDDLYCAARKVQNGRTIFPFIDVGGIAAAICDELEQNVRADKITTHASITAKPFFEHRGYKVVREQQVIRDGTPLTNFVMEK